MISPAFFEDEHIGELEWVQMVLFIGIWTLSDREGRVEERPLYFLSELFRYNKVMTCDDIVRHLQALSSPHPFIIRYEVGNKRFIQVKNFSKYQHVHPHERKSTIPPPPDVITLSSDVSSMYGSSTSTSTSKDPPSPLNGSNGKPASKRAPAAKPDPEREAWFTEWYALYPRHEAKADALRAFMKHIKNRELYRLMLAALKSQLPRLQAKETEYRPLPATWINQARWEDEADTPMLFPAQPKLMSARDVIAAQRQGPDGN